MGRALKRLSLTAWIFIGMAAGVALGAFAPGVARQLGPISAIFLRLIRSIIAPLIFGTLVYGIAGGGDLKRMGRIGLKAIVYFEVVTTFALFLGLAAVNLVRPGVGMKLAQTSAEAALPHERPSAGSTIEHVFPASIIDAMARGDVLEIVVFAFLFGAACAAVGAKAAPVVAFCESLAEVMFRYTKYVMYLAPLGVGAALAVTVGSKGSGVLFGLGKLILTMYAAQVLFVVLVLGAVVLLVRIPLGAFYRAVREPFLIAFSTASSEAALPLALENMECFGVPKHIVAFVIPDGLQLQPGWQHAVFVAGVRVRGAGRRGEPILRTAIAHDADPDAHQQRRGRSAPGSAGDPGGHAIDVSSSHGRRGRVAGDRCADGHGAHVGERGGELPGERGGGSVGGSG